MITGAVLGAGAVAAVWFVARQIGRGRPCPTIVAGFFDNQIAQRFSGVDTIIERAGISAGMKVLDAGCGPGRLTIPLARQVGVDGSVVALDVQEGMLARVRKRVTEAGLTNVRTVRAALGLEHSSVAQEARTFDRAVLVTVLGEIPDPVPALRAIRQLLTRDGVLSITEMIVDPDYVTPSRVRSLAEEAGFRHERTFGSPLLHTHNFRNG